MQVRKTEEWQLTKNIFWSCLYHAKKRVAILITWGNVRYAEFDEAGAKEFEVAYKGGNFNLIKAVLEVKGGFFTT